MCTNSIPAKRTLATKVLEAEHRPDDALDGPVIVLARNADHAN
jgi:hypothetical protein